MSTQFRRRAPELPGLDRSATTPVRDALAATHERVECQQPRALDLLAVALDAGRHLLHGAMGPLAGSHSEKAWREMWRGERTFPLYDLARLAVATTTEAQDAADAMLFDLAKARGWALVPRRVKRVNPFDAARQLAVIPAQALDALLSALQNDGRIDEAEAVALKPHAPAIRALAELLEGVTEPDRRRTVRGVPSTTPHRNPTEQDPTALHSAAAPEGRDPSGAQPSARRTGSW